MILEEHQSRRTINHVESGIRYVSLCGEVFDEDDVERVPYETADEGWGASHEYFCSDCHSVGNRRAVNRGPGGEA